jgi:RNA polymerase sigma-70 factor (ECF subfamily)
MGRTEPNREETAGTVHRVEGAASAGAGKPPDTTSLRPVPPEAFAAHFQQAYRVLWLIAAGIVGDRQAAEDVVQEAALLALEKFDQFQAGTNFRAWMAQMVRYVGLNHARRRQKQRASPLEGEGGPRVAAPAHAGALRLGPRGELPPDQSAFDDRLLAALQSVSEVPRACLLLRTVECLEYSEIARVLEIPEGTAMSHVHRTRQSLRLRLGAAIVEGRGDRGGAARQPQPIPGPRQAGHGAEQEEQHR